MDRKDVMSDPDVVIKLLGDVAVGKTSMLFSYVNNAFPSDYIPSCFDDYNGTVLIQGKQRVIKFQDTHIGYGLKMHEEVKAWERIRSDIYPSVDVFILVFSVVNRVSFENIEKKWIKEVLEHSKNKKFIIVGNKNDLKDNKVVKLEELEILAKKYDVSYVVCSAKTQKNLKLIFDTAYESYFEATFEMIFEMIYEAEVHPSPSQ